jgi:hypothetical protein
MFHGVCRRGYDAIRGGADSPVGELRGAGTRLDYGLNTFYGVRRVGLLGMAVRRC